MHQMIRYCIVCGRVFISKIEYNLYKDNLYIITIFNKAIIY